MQDFRNLEAWQLARALRNSVYAVSRRFPREERYVLTTPLRRSASSIGWNIAEGSGRGSDADFARCLQLSLSSECECLDQLIQASDLEYVTGAEFTELSGRAEEVGRKLNRLIRYLRRR
jgi:four helix bundle protein